jgi:hypothetical protein
MSQQSDEEWAREQAGDLLRSKFYSRYLSLEASTLQLASLLLAAIQRGREHMAPKYAGRGTPDPYVHDPDED